MSESYDKNNIFEVKGAIGELLAANYLWYQCNIDSQLADEELQKLGVDLSFRAEFEHHVDVKLSDCDNNFFTITYSNAKGLRHPFRTNCKAHEIIIVDYDWNTYLQCNVEKIKNKTEEDLIKDLGEYVEDKALKNLVQVTRRSSKETIQALTELYVAHRTLDRLKVEFKNRKHTNQQFLDTKNLINKYTRSIFSTHISAILNIVSGFDRMEYGEGKVFNSTLVVSKEYRRDRFSNGIIIAKINRLALEKKDRLIYYYSPQVIVNQKPSLDTCVPISFGKHKGTPIQDLPNSYLSWLITASNKHGLDEIIESEYQYRQGNKSLRG